MAERALTVAPRYSTAILCLAAAELAEGSTTRCEFVVRAMLDSGLTSVLDRSSAMRLLADCLDKQGRAADAFAAYSEANELLKQLYADRFPDAEASLKYIRAMLDYFDSAQINEWARSKFASADAGAAREHVFLLGFPRSGTTLLEVMLEGHPSVSSLEECELLIDGVRRFMMHANDLSALANAAEWELQSLRDAYWRRVTEAGADVSGRVFVDKYPLNTLKLPLLVKLFPNAKIVIARRDPRDVVFSCFRRRFRMNYPMYQLLTLDGCAAFYDSAMLFLERFSVVLGPNAYMARHESIVEHPSSELRRLCAFLNLPWREGMTDFAVRVQERVFVTPSTAQLARGLNSHGIARWKSYSKELQQIMPTLSPWIKRYGYDQTC
jgi:hypothetical protein